MDSILNKIYQKQNNKKSKKSKCEELEKQINLELELKIEAEKTKQLELIKDIKKIELNIKQKELYALSRKNNLISFSSSNDDSSDCESEKEEEIDNLI